SIELMGFQWVGAGCPPLERGRDDVRSAAGGHDFFAVGHKLRTHDAGVLKKAAAAVALLKVADERSVLEREREDRLKWKLERPREIFAQMTIDPVPLIGENLSWIKNVLRIKCALDF